MGEEPTTEDTIGDWPKKLQDAYSSQQRIGWEQMFYGRLTKEWASEKLSQSGDSNFSNNGLNQKIIWILWIFGLDMWKERNSLVHGKGQISTQSLERARSLVKAINSELAPKFGGSSQGWIFTSHENIQSAGYYSQTVWLASVKTLFPEEFKKVETKMVGKEYHQQKTIMKEEQNF